MAFAREPASCLTVSIKTVTSHPQALSQCHDYIKMRGFKTEEANNTALAAKAVAEANDKSFGAIASVETAELYGLKIIEPNINKSGENNPNKPFS